MHGISSRQRSRMVRPDMQQTRQCSEARAMGQRCILLIRCGPTDHTDSRGEFPAVNPAVNVVLCEVVSTGWVWVGCLGWVFGVDIWGGYAGQRVQQRPWYSEFNNEGIITHTGNGVVRVG